MGSCLERHPLRGWWHRGERGSEWSPSEFLAIEALREKRTVGVRRLVYQRGLCPWVSKLEKCESVYRSELGQSGRSGLTFTTLGKVPWGRSGLTPTTLGKVPWSLFIYLFIS